MEIIDNRRIEFIQNTKGQYAFHYNPYSPGWTYEEFSKKDGRKIGGSSRAIEDFRDFIDDLIESFN